MKCVDPSTLENGNDAAEFDRALATHVWVLARFEKFDLNNSALVRCYCADCKLERVTIVAREDIKKK